MRSAAPERKLLGVIQGMERMRPRRLIRRLCDWVRMGSVTGAYGEWRSECYAVRDAYRLWICARALDERSAFVAYTAALDREERAAMRYARLIRRASRSAETELAPQLARIQTGHGLR